MPQRLPVKTPRFWAALRLRCVYCGKTPLRQSGKWFSFAKGCPECDYQFEREEGYYTGASWMVNFPVTSVLAFMVGVVLVTMFPNIAAEGIAAIVGLVMLAFGAWFTPFSMAIWIYFEHLFHPLTSEDRFDGLN